MKRYEMHDPKLNIRDDRSTVEVRQSPENRAVRLCRPCEEKRLRDLEAARESRKPS